MGSPEFSGILSFIQVEVNHRGNCYDLQVGALTVKTLNCLAFFLLLPSEAVCPNKEVRWKLEFYLKIVKKTYIVTATIFVKKLSSLSALPIMSRECLFLLIFCSGDIIVETVHKQAPNSS
uniref:Uncharacterized protein n=1 Tax=Cuerna arida TaxID=1464854 RepID=A0A1B6GAJ7_9HEMI